MSDTFDKTPKIFIFFGALLLIRIGLMAVGYKLYIPYLDDLLLYLLEGFYKLKAIVDEFLSQYRQQPQ